MAVYQVVLEVEADDEDIIRSRDAASLEDMKASAKDDEYLDFYVEDEFAWVHSSFSYVKVKSVKRIGFKKPAIDD